jgi:cytochrome d ubiquinol oxidase subunit II
VIAAIGPLWTWHEVWLLASGGVLFAAFPRFLASACAAYYLAIFLVLWSLILRGVALEVGGHIGDPLWQTLWDVVFALANILLAVVLGAALGNVIRGAPLDATGNFHMAFFTDFGVRGDVGLLDWYTVSLGVFALVTLSAHGATYLALKTEGAVHDRSAALMRWLWPVVFALLALITVETWYVRPDLQGSMLGRPNAWLAILAVVAGAAAIIRNLKPGPAMNEAARMADEKGAPPASSFILHPSSLPLWGFIGSCVLIAGLLLGAAAVLFPMMLYSTLDPEHSLTAYNSSSSPASLAAALIWWPIALVLTFAYAWFVSRFYRGKVKTATDAHAPY